jgi:hypothetical protein
MYALHRSRHAKTCVGREKKKSFSTVIKGTVSRELGDFFMDIHRKSIILRFTAGIFNIFMSCRH